MTAYNGTVVGTPRWQAGTIQEVIGYYDLAGAVVTADTFTWSNILPSLNNPVELLDFERWGQELDTDASPTATEIIGDAGDTDGLLKSKVTGNALTQFIMKGDGAYLGTGAKHTSSRNAVLTLGGTVATAATTGRIWVRLRYYCIGG